MYSAPNRVFAALCRIFSKQFRIQSLPSTLGTSSPTHVCSNQFRLWSIQFPVLSSRVVSCPHLSHPCRFGSIHLQIRADQLNARLFQIVSTYSPILAFFLITSPLQVASNRCESSHGHSASCSSLLIPLKSSQIGTTPSQVVATRLRSIPCQLGSPRFASSPVPVLLRYRCHWV